MGKFEDLKGQRFGRLTVIERAETKGKKTMWKCRCVCGNECIVRSDHMKSGRIVSCGCARIGHFVSEETRKKLSIAQQKDGNSNYNHDLTEEERKQDRRYDLGYKKWAKDVKEQANFTCDICGERGGRLASHHLNCHSKYKEQRYDVSNGVCLCEHCHKEFHSYMGGANKPCTAEDYYKWKQIKQENLDSKTEDVA